MVSLDFQLFCLASVAAYGGLHVWLRRHEGLGVPALVWVALGALLVGGSFVVHLAELREKKRLTEELSSWGPTYAVELQRLGHDQISAETQVDDPVYLQLIETQKRWLTLNPLVSDIYSLGRDASGQGVLLVDSETDYNRNGRYDSAREERTVVGEPYSRLVPALERAFAGETVVDTDVYSDRWGTWISAYTPIRDPAGKVTAVLGLDFDAHTWLHSLAHARAYWIALLGLIVLIGAGAWVAFSNHTLTQRQESLLSNTQTLKTYLDSLPFPCWAVDTQGVFTLFNQRAREQWGRDLTGKSLRNPGHGLDPELAATWFDRQQRALRGESIDTQDIAIGESGPRTLHHMIGPMRDGEQTVGAIGTQLDITAQAQSVEARRHAQDKLALHLRQTTVAIVEWDTTFVITGWNPAAAALFGLTAEDAVGQRGIHLLFPVHERADIELDWSNLLRSGGVRSADHHHALADGSTRLCAWTHTPLLDASGAAIGMASIVHDLTAREKVRQATEQKQRLDSVSRLAGGVAEELQASFTPAMLHLGHLEQAAVRLGGLDEHIRPVRHAFSHTLDLSERLLALGRNDGLVPTDWQPLNPTVQDTVELFRRSLDPRIRLLVLLGGDLPPLPFSTSLLSDVLVNLLTNARNAMLGLIADGAPHPEWKPVIKVTTSRITSASRPSVHGALPQPESFQCISISDTGGGLDEPTREHLFEAYASRPGSSRKTGLGLAITWKAVNALGGRIEVENRPGEGATFHVFLPSPKAPVSKAQPSPDAADAAPRMPGSKSVLLAEDDELITRAMTIALRRSGHRITCSTDGAAALALVRLEPTAYDLVITDLNMPNLGGRDFLVALQRDHISVPVVVLSGHLTSAIYDELHHLGVAEVLRKPLRIEEIVQTVERHTSGRPADHLT
jgi:PAS domain S-box-containing protein